MGRGKRQEKSGVSPIVPLAEQAAPSTESTEEGIKAVDAAAAPSAPAAVAATSVLAPQPLKPYVFYPSDLTWLYNECPHCFYLKVRHGVKRPGGNMPSIFRHIDTQIRSYCMDLKRTELVCPAMPRGEFISGEVWVRSKAFSIAGHRTKFVLGGKPDGIVKWDDGGYGIIDYKTTAVKASSGSFYAKQLEIYSRAVETPSKDDAEVLAPVTLNGLLAWEPKLFAADGQPDGLDLKGKLTWIPVERQVDDLRSILDGVMTVLDSDQAPTPSPSCGYCRYRGDFARLEASEQQRQQEGTQSASQLRLDDDAPAA